MQGRYCRKEQFHLLNNQTSEYKTTKMNPKVRIFMSKFTINSTTPQLKTHNSILLWSKAYFYLWRVAYFHIKTFLNDSFINFVFSILLLHILCCIK
jgi:hypothetical protein